VHCVGRTENGGFWEESPVRVGGVKEAEETEGRNTRSLTERSNVLNATI
jgi:hypothetical protein